MFSNNIVSNNESNIGVKIKGVEIKGVEIKGEGIKGKGGEMVDLDSQLVLIKTDINNILAKSIGKQFTTTNISSDTIHSIPKKHGLENSEEIIPSLYFTLNKNNINILDIDYYEIIRNDIANCRCLNSYQLEYIQHYLQNDEKMELKTL